ncbi:Cadherin-86C like protein [Argiope bruennichi]|uniref:Cadherin-86C like protein n=1 Tax=Argiope bruennichi TaxID=94029 RepID=A0A8T0EMB5_ARGBR|nr:Cadherin-86C like protein [Argiope bruennichi]
MTYETVPDYLPTTLQDISGGAPHQQMRYRNRKLRRLRYNPPACCKCLRLNGAYIEIYHSCKAQQKFFCVRVSLTEEKEVIGSMVVRKRNSSSLPVLFEVEGSDNFAIRYLISPLKEATKGEIFLLQKLDYEKKNLYTLTIYALNPWTEEEFDTRNVAVQTILVAVKDAQDTPPVFQSLPPVVRVSDSLPLVRVAPTIDLSHNMRILKLPMDTKPGSLIYRLRGSDPDNDILTFGVRGDVGNQLLRIQSVTETRANVFLKAAPTEKEYKLTIYVTDGTQTTEVESTIIITNATNIKSPFLEYEPLISVSELTEEKEVDWQHGGAQAQQQQPPCSASKWKDRTNFAIDTPQPPQGSHQRGKFFFFRNRVRGRRISYTLSRFYALNPKVHGILCLRRVWTSQNVAVRPILVAVKDAQDTHPASSLSTNRQGLLIAWPLGGSVFQVHAEDGDFGNQRNITYSFVPESQGVTYFNINSRTGMITLASSTELFREAYSTTGPFVLSIQATEVESDLVPGLPASSIATLAVVLVNTENKPPRFLSRRYVGVIEENSPGLTPIIWEGSEVPKVVDDDQGKNGSFELFLEDDGGAFSVQPSRGMNELNFALLVKDPTKLDYETSDTKYIEFRIVARETASVRPLSATAEIRVRLLDANDNIPQFSHDVYNVTLPEDAPVGTTLIKIQATDEDSGSYGVVRYTAVNGPIAGNLRLDPVSGELTLVSSEGLDRERIPEYSLTVEARDDQGKGNRNMAEVHVTLADANDNAPLFLQPRYDAVLNPDMRNFYEPLRVQAYDADGPGPNSDITYEIVNGNYQEKFLIDSHTGELSLQAPLVPNPETQDHGLPVITLTVRAHDQGVPVRFATVKVQVHNQTPKNNIAKDCFSGKKMLGKSAPVMKIIKEKMPPTSGPINQQNDEVGFSALTGAHVNLHSIAFHNSSTEKSVVRCWVSYPLSSTVDLSNMDAIIRNMFGQDHYMTSSKVEAINRSSFDVVFWLLIALVILMVLAILALFFYCCCVRSAEGRDILELKNKVVPEETIIHYKEEGVQAQNNNNDSRRKPDSRTRSTGGRKPAKASEKVSQKNSRPEDVPVRGAYYPDGGIPVVAGGRMERAYRRGRPLSPGTEMLVQEMGGESEARRLGNYVVVRKVVRPRVRVDPAEEGMTQDGENGPRRTEILYIRSPMREDEEERHYVREGELLRSVSETALNTDDLHLRVPRSYRTRGVPLQRMEPLQDPAASQQLKFSRYHRTEGDVIVATDEVPEMDRSYVGPDPSWGPVYSQHGEYIRVPRQRDERWESHPEYHPQRLQGPEESRSRFPPEHNLSHANPSGFMNQARIQPGSLRDLRPQAVYHEQYQEQDVSHRQYAPHPSHHPVDQIPLQRTLPPQPTFEPQRIPDQTSHPFDRQNDPDDDARTVIMAPGKSRLNEFPQNETTQVYQDENFHQQAEQFTSSFENQQEEQHQQSTVTFQEDHEHFEETTETRAESAGEGDEPVQQDEVAAQPLEDHYQRRQSIRPSTQRLSTDDSGALSGKDKLGMDDTDMMDSRETHEESDRLGHRTTEDEISRAEEQNQQTDGEDEDSDSGIGKDGTALRLKKSNLMEKKSLFTIAYDGMQTRGLKSAEKEMTHPNKYLMIYEQ